MARSKTMIADLIKRVEEASAPSLDLDYAIHTALKLADPNVDAYTASVDAVIALIGATMPGASWTVYFSDKRYGATVYPADYHDTYLKYSGGGASPALALLLAFLRAWEARDA